MICQPPSRSASEHLDARLARWRTMLAKRYKNDQNEGLTYVTPSGHALPLTPAMVLDWARAMVRVSYTLILKKSHYIAGGRAGNIGYAAKHSIFRSCK